MPDTQTPRRYVSYARELYWRENREAQTYHSLTLKLALAHRHAPPTWELFSWKQTSDLFEFHLSPLPLAGAAKDDSDGEDGGDDAEDDEGDVVTVGRVVEVGVEVAHVADGDHFDGLAVQLQPLPHQLLAPVAKQITVSIKGRMHGCALFQQVKLITE